MEVTDNRSLMVSIRCATYNHAPYIRQCLDGFVMQKTNFRFEAIVHDDASTDGTTDIVREYAAKYPDIIKPMYETENQYSKNLSAMNNAINARLNGKYVAICEGDDYWTDPLKLQKQFDFLENNKDKDLVYTNCDVLKDGVLHKNVFTTGYFKPTQGYKDFLLEGKFIVPCSWLFRKEERYNLDVPASSSDSSLCIAFLFLLKNKVGYIDQNTCTYRLANGSTSHSSDISRRYKYYLGAFKSERTYMDLYSDYFDDGDRAFLYNRRYKLIIPYAAALDDKSMIDKIKNVPFLDLNLIYRGILVLYKLPPFRKLLLKIIQLRIR